MTNGNELRIGNWVRFKHLLCFIITIKQDNCEIQSSRLVVNSSYDFIEPIPLTPEILEKCGFWLHKDLWYIYRHHARIRITKGFELLLDGNLWLELKYLHQLQNLIFALTGEELTFKPQNK